MTTIDNLRKIHRIDLSSRKLVNSSLVGAYHSAFKGRGSEFASVRHYEPGDDTRLIDWKVSARTGSVFVRQQIEERELTVTIVMDISASTLFGSHGQLKRDLSAELASILAYAAIRNNDRVGLLLFTSQTELYVPPRKGRNHILRLIRDLLTVEPKNTGTDIGLALRQVSQALKQRSVIFLISDFLSPLSTYEAELSLVGFTHDVVAIILGDALEHKWPTVGLVEVIDSETNERMWIDTDAKGWHGIFTQQSLRLQNHIDTALMRANVDRVRVMTNTDYVTPLAVMLRKRGQKRWR